MEVRRRNASKHGALKIGGGRGPSGVEVWHRSSITTRSCGTVALNLAPFNLNITLTYTHAPFGLKGHAIAMLTLSPSHTAARSPLLTLNAPLALD